MALASCQMQSSCAIVHSQVCLPTKHEQQPQNVEVAMESCKVQGCCCCPNLYSSLTGVVKCNAVRPSFIRVSLFAPASRSVLCGCHVQSLSTVIQSDRLSVGIALKQRLKNFQVATGSCKNEPVCLCLPSPSATAVWLCQSWAAALSCHVQGCQAISLVSLGPQQQLHNWNYPFQTAKCKAVPLSSPTKS